MGVAPSVTSGAIFKRKLIQAGMKLGSKAQGLYILGIFVLQVLHQVKNPGTNQEW